MCRFLNELNMMVRNDLKTLKSCSWYDYKLNNHMICHTRRKSEPKNRKSFLGSTMVNVASHIPTGFSMRHAFTLLFIQLLTISNYLSISRLKSSAIVEAIKIESINFPSHIEIGLPVSIIKIKFKHKYYSFVI